MCSEIKIKLLLLKAELENNLTLLKKIESMIEEKGKETFNTQRSKMLLNEILMLINKEI